MSMKEELLRKIENKEIKVGVVGLGYVGLPLAVEKAKAGFFTVGFDVQRQKVEMVCRGHNYIPDVSDNDLRAAVRAGMLTATTDFSIVASMDFIAICVPTPLDRNRQPDLSYVHDSAAQVGKHLRRGSMVVLESTTYPGTTEELLKPLLEQESGLVCGKDFYLAFSPERVDPGNPRYKTKNIPKVVGAVGRDAGQVISAMYRKVLEGQVHQVSGPRVAEMEKILENTYRNINIGLANEMAIICNKMGIDVWEVIDAAKTKPYGFEAFYPGPGLGGHCIPLDPFYLTWKAREYDYHTRLIETSGEINSYMPQYVAERAAQILNRDKKSLSSARLLLLGIAYKQDIGDCRESPAIKVIEHLRSAGALVDFYDPYVAEYEYNGVKNRGLREIDEQILDSYDLVLVTAAHTNVDYNLVQRGAHWVFDTKNALRNVPKRDNIVLL